MEVRSKEEVREEFGMKMNQDVNGNKKVFRKEVRKANGGKVENSNKINDGNGRLVLEEAEVRRIWQEYYEDLYIIDTQERLQSTCVALMELGEVATLEESRLG